MYHLPGALLDVSFITLPAGAFAKYCSKHVCVCVCLSMKISVESHMRFLPDFLCMLLMAMARFSSGRVTICKGQCCGFLPR